MSEVITNPVATDATLNRLIDVVDSKTFGPNIVDNLVTESATKALSANQGKVLDDKIVVNTSAIESLNWTYVGSVTGTTSIELPTGWKEAEIYLLYTDDTIRITMRSDLFGKYTSGAVTLHGGSLSRSCRVQVDPSNNKVTLSAYWKTAVSTSLGTIDNVTASTTLYVWAR